MNGCQACFRDRGPIALETSEGELGQCDFCGSAAVPVWSVEGWVDHFAALLDMYELAAEGQPLARRLQADWQVFSSTDPTLAERYLAAVFPDGHLLLNGDPLVRPRFSDHGAAADHTTRWEAFRNELIRVNRFFPSVEFDHDFLRDVIHGNSKRLGAGLELFRGRLCDGPQPWPPDQMGMAPERKVPAGRGNPVGIPHLYLASDVHTCLKESRALQHGFVSVATFLITRPISYLDLVELEPRNPFLIAADDSDLVEVLVTSRFLAELGEELSKPTRPGENQLEYVPTQYLCEFVKASGIGGIRYRSALHPEGWNIVLFDATRAELSPDPPAGWGGASVA